MNRISDREKVIDVYGNARFDRNRNAPWQRQCAIYVGERQISDPCGTSAKAWSSARRGVLIVMNAPKTEAGRAD